MIGILEKSDKPALSQYELPCCLHGEVLNTPKSEDRVLNAQLKEGC